MLLNQLLIVIEFSGYGAGTNHLDLSGLVDDDVPRVDISYLFLQTLKFILRSDHVVQQVPYFSLHKFLLQIPSI